MGLSGSLRRVPLGILLLFVLLAAGIGAAGRVYYQREQRQFKEAVRNQLASIADLKVGQIMRWRAERTGDAEVLRRYFSGPGGADLFPARAPGAGIARHTRELLAAFLEQNGYENILVMDRQAAVRFSFPGAVPRPGPLCAAVAAEALRSRTVVFSDLHRDAVSPAPHLCVAAPIARPEGGGAPAGVLLLHIDPRRFLYPLIQSWPTPSPTAETLLGRREGDEVVYLSELRHRKGAALTLRLPLDSEVVAALAVQGREGVMEGRDYREVAVLAAVRRVPHTPWLLVAKVDAEEVYAPLRERAGWLSMVVGLLVAAAGALLALLWWRQRNVSYRRQYAAQQLHTLILETSQDGLWVLDAQGRILETNDAYCELVGYSRQELLAMRVQDLEAQEAEEETHRHIARVMATGRDRFETRHRSKDGRIIDVEISTRYLPQEGGRLVAFTRDITERKGAEEALRESEAALARSHEELRGLTARLLTAQEEERRRVSRELHDDVNQRLAVLAMQIDTLRTGLPLPAGKLRRELESLEARVAAVSDDVRRMASDLHPSVVEHLGLAAALRSHCAQFASRERIPVAFEERDVPEELPPELALCLYRIAQEALRNLARHSRATRGKATVTGSAEGVELAITDDGVGFDPQLVRAGAGLGLVGMEERARLVGGVLAISSSPGQGTRIEVRAPWPNRAV
jgi:PAS domain S-box-containing protein